MRIGVRSEDVRLCNQLAVMCNENNFKIIFINEDDDVINDIDYVVIDIDTDIDSAVEKCSEYDKIKSMVFGVITTPTKSIILRAKDAGCLIVLTRSNFSANLLDIIKKQIK